VCKCWLVKCKPWKRLWIPPGGMECGRCVAHFISLLMDFKNLWNKKIKCILTLENGSKGLHTLWKKRGMKKREEGRILGAPDDEKFDFRQHFLLLFLRPAKNQQAIYFRIPWIDQIKEHKLMLLKHLKICDFFLKTSTLSANLDLDLIYIWLTKYDFNIRIFRYKIFQTQITGNWERFEF